MKKFFSLLAAVAFLCGGVENLVKNPSFEELTKNGNPRYWSLPRPLWSVDKNIRSSGKNSLKYSNQNPLVYKFCVQNIKVEPGKSYRFGGIVRYSGVKKGPGDICLEVFDKKGKYLKGYYPQGPKGFTSEWMEINYTAVNIPQGAAGARICCYARKGTTGNIWFDDIFANEVEVPLLAEFTSSAYRAAADSRNVYFFISTNRPVSSRDLAKGKLFAVQKGKRTAVPILRRRAGSDTITLEVLVHRLPIGKMTLEFSLDSAGKTEKASMAFERVRKLPARKVYVDRFQRIIADGKPFFPIGLYLPVYPLPEKEIKFISQGPFNSVLPYAELDRKQLDVMHKYNLKVFYNLKDTLSHKRNGKNDPIKLFSQKLLAVKGHPSLLCYYINDEAAISMVKILERARAQAEKLDPQLPTYSCMLNLAEMRKYIDSLEITGSDPYPVPHQPTALVRDWTRKVRHGSFYSRSLIMVIQAFNWAYPWQRYGRTPEEVARCRSPKLKELRAMTWMSIAEGAKGVLFYSYMDLKRMANPPAGLKKEDFNARWNDLKTVAKEVKDKTEILLSTEPAPTLKNARIPGFVSRKTFSLKGKKYILLVNTSDKAAAKVRLSGTEFELKPLDVYFEALAK